MHAFIDNLCILSLVIYALFQDPLNRAAAPPIMEKAKKPNKQQAASTADLYKQVVSSSFITMLLNSYNNYEPLYFSLICICTLRLMISCWIWPGLHLQFMMYVFLFQTMSKGGLNTWWGGKYLNIYFAFQC